MLPSPRHKKKNQTLEFNRKRANPNLLGLVFSEFFLGDFPGGLLLAATIIIVTVVGVMLTLRAPVAAAAAAASSFLAPPRVPWLRWRVLGVRVVGLRLGLGLWIVGSSGSASLWRRRRFLVALSASLVTIHCAWVLCERLLLVKLFFIYLLVLCRVLEPTKTICC